jgi:hypothetical protein
MEYGCEFSTWLEWDREEILLTPFSRTSLLTRYAGWLIQADLVDEVHELRIDKREMRSIGRGGKITAPIDSILECYGLQPLALHELLENDESVNRDIPADQLEDLVKDRFDEEFGSMPVLDLADIIAQEVFFVLFSIRPTLWRFNWHLAIAAQGLQKDHIPMHLRDFADESGLPEEMEAPEWARDAVARRDGFACVRCRRPAARIESGWPAHCFSYLIPPADGGVNDVTNLVFTCSECAASTEASGFNEYASMHRWF